VRESCLTQMKSKKAQLGTLQTIVIALIVIGIVLGIGFMVLDEYKDSVEDQTATTTITVLNETVTSVTEKAQYLANNISTNGIYCYNSMAIILVENATASLVIDSANYTARSNGSIQFTGVDVLHNNTNWNVSYTFKRDNSGACEGVTKTIDATKKIPTWLAIIVILAIVGILLAIVFRVLPGRQTGEGGSFGGGDTGTVAEI